MRHQTRARHTQGDAGKNLHWSTIEMFFSWPEDPFYSIDFIVIMFNGIRNLISYIYILLMIR